MDEYIFLIIFIFVACWYAYYEYTRGTSPYRGRKCNGKAWKTTFPEASNDDIREFLECFVDGMTFSSKIKLKFHPNDQVIDVYRSLYFGRTPMGDQMECEIFLENLSSSFNVELGELIESWHEQVTLGELFTKINDKGKRN